MKRKLGFTMIEMTIVLIMIGILTASLAPLLLRQHTTTMEDRDRVALDAMKTAIISYAATFGGIPDASAVLINGISVSAVSAVPAFGVNNWGAFGDSATNPFRLDVNDKLTLTGVQNLGGTANGDRVVFCQAVNQQMQNAAAAPFVCQEYTTDHVLSASKCTSTAPVAFVLYSTGNNRTADQENNEIATGTTGATAGNNRIYENDKRGINNSTEGASHYDDQVMSYPLSALARDCRERMGVLPEVMNCPAPGQKYVGSVSNNTATAVSYTLGAAGATASSIPANGTVLVNQCFARSGITMTVGTQASAVGTVDTNSDGRVDFVITGASSFTAQ